MRKEGRLLVDRSDAEGSRRVWIDVRQGRAAHDQGTGISMLGAGDDLDQRGLAGTVLPDKSVHLAGAEIERHAIERAEPGEGLADVSSVEEQTGHGPRGRMLPQPPGRTSRWTRCALHNAKPLKFSQKHRIYRTGLTIYRTV